MTINDKIIHNSGNEVHLYKEGVFWIAYEQSAYLVSRVKTFKPTRKYVKKLGKDIISLGFPDASLEKITPHFKLIRRTDVQVDLESEISLNREEYEAWVETIEEFKGFKEIKEFKDSKEDEVQPAEAVQIPEPVEKKVIERIRAFDIANASPMECLIFVNALKNQL